MFRKRGLRINATGTKSWLLSKINAVLCYVDRNILRLLTFQIGTFGIVVTTRPS